jgi:hypothetical protein
MRKFCWEYKDTQTGLTVLVQRPHRRAVNPVYFVDGFEQEYPAAKFRKRFKFLGRMKRESHSPIEFCKSHKVDHTGTWCGECVEMWRKAYHRKS